jgi:hypothetical protein
LRRISAHVNLLSAAYFVQNVLHAVRIYGVDFKNNLPGLQIVNDFLHIGAGRNKAHVVFVFVNAVAKHLLALFIYGVYVIQQYEFFFAMNERSGLTKYFHVGAVVLDALVLQAVQYHDVFRVVAIAVILTNNCVHQGRFTGPGISHYQ